MSAEWKMKAVKFRDNIVRTKEKIFHKILHIQLFNNINQVGYLVRTDRLSRIGGAR